MIVLADFWHCLNRSDLLNNTNYTFPNKALPVIDQTFSFLGAVINILFMLTIYVRCKRLGTTPLSSIFYACICLANLVECANCILIFKSSEVGPTLPTDGINYYLYIASGIEDTIHFVRIGFFLPVYVIRLMYVVLPTRFSAHSRPVIHWDKVYCVSIWILGALIGGFRAYIRIKIAELEGDKAGVMEKISFALVLVNLVFHGVGMGVFFGTILYLIKIYCKYRPRPVENPDCEECNRQGFQVIDRGNVIFSAVNPALQLLTLLFFTELIFHVYLALLSFVTMKIYFTPACYPEVFVKIRNYLGTPSNFVYSYHCLGVLHGITICIIFFSQNTMKQTVRFMWRVAGLLARFSVTKYRAKQRGESQTMPSFYSVIGHEDTI